MKPGAALGVALTMVLVGCSARATLPEAVRYATWQSEGEQAPRYTLPAADFPQDQAAPWAGTASHHLLTAPLLDEWFRQLALRRNIKTFYILSPSHGDRNVQLWAIARGTWKVEGGFVETDDQLSLRVAARLGVLLEPGPFQYEHGVHVFMPFIHHYFPSAKVVAIAYAGEPPVNMQNARALAASLAPEFESPVAEGKFLLVSTDFSHHGDVAQTAAKDARSVEFWRHPSLANWVLVGCDNRPGIYVLASLLRARDRVSVQWHTNAYVLSGHDANDITSYFFTWVW